MASLIVDQAHPLELLGLSVVVDGVLVDCETSPTFVIEDVTTLPATTIRSSTSGTKVGTGRYVAKVSGSAWTPTSTVAEARIVWTFTPPGGEQTTVIKRFEVVDDDVGERGELTYTTVAAVKALRPELASYSSRKIRDCILDWKDVIDTHCRHTFALRYETRKLKGSDDRVMFLDEPLFGLYEIYLNGDTTATANTYFTVLSDRKARWNPKIEFDEVALNAEYGGLFTRTLREGNFSKRLYQSITGVWGFVDQDTQQAPRAVKQACAIGVGLDIASRREAGGVAMGSPGLVRAEETDMHRIEYSITGRVSVPGHIAILRDPVVRDLLSQYRRPASMGWVG